ncbi:hypothetical protein HanIR_Chr09g0421431 [Helianthus annuus]|nr:hypothetical protein HanIR_Chr09g0421431 [Helianthus annuus]
MPQKISIRVLHRSQSITKANTCYDNIDTCTDVVRSTLGEIKSNGRFKLHKHD